MLRLVSIPLTSWEISRSVYGEQRLICLLGITLATALGPSLWLWDYVVDPVGAQSTLWPRLALAPIGLIYLLALALRSSIVVASLAGALTLLGWEAWLLLAILPRLDDGMALAPGAAMYFVVMPLVMTGCLPITVNAAIMVAGLALPAALWSAGLLPGFPLPTYVAQLLPASVMALSSLGALTFAHRDRLRHWQTLQNAQVQLDAVLNNLPGIVYTARYDPNGIVGIDWVDGGHLTLPGMPMHTLTSLSCDQLMARYHPEDVRLFSEVYAALRHDEHVVVQARLGRPDGRWTWVKHRIGFVDRQGDMVVVAGVMLDVTAEMEAKAELERQQEQRRRLDIRDMESRKLVALGKLAGGIAHDCNNILGAMIGYAGFLAADCDPSQRSHRYATGILKAGQRGKVLVEQILAFARKWPPERNPVDASELVLESQDLIRMAVPSTIELYVDLRDGLIVDVDRAQLGQVIMNLCLNARDALPEKSGVVMVRVREAVVGHPRVTRVLEGEGGIERWSDDDGVGWVVAGALRPGVSYASLIVEDTGTGMSAPVLNHVFDPFFTTKATGHGIGMGLAVVHGVVMSHDGAIILRSHDGLGTKVEILLPVCEPLPAAATPQLEEPSGGRARLLVVDDDADGCEMLSEGLERLGWVVVASRSPAKALTLLKDHGPWDLMVSDQIMPGLKGTDLVRQARAIQPDLPCLLCTGYDHALSEADATAAGAAGLMRKPLKIDMVHARLLEMLPLSGR
jgi:signal transduction histidine kinase/CheY-like chemotaxis protein